MRKLSVSIISVLLLLQVSAQNWNQTQKMFASDKNMFDNLGKSVSISGNYAIVGTYIEAHNVIGSSFMNEAGSAYIYEKDSIGNWNQVQKVVASDRNTNDRFGWSVSISNNFAIVGALWEDEDSIGVNTMIEAGSAYIFERNSSGVWNQAQKIVALDRTAGATFGHSVSISSNYIIVGTSKECNDANGLNYMYKAGSAYIFEKDNNGIWYQTQKIVPTDRAIGDLFGESVSIDSNFAIAGARWEDEDTVGGNTMSKAGSSYIFERNVGGVWSQAQKIIASDRNNGDLFGFSVSISGNNAIVSAYYEDEDASGGNTMNKSGSAYIFKRNSIGNWTQVQKIVASDRDIDDEFGYAVAIGDNCAIVGAHNEDHDSLGGNYMTLSGSAYIYSKSGTGNWKQVQKITAPDRAPYDCFGTSVSISNNHVIIGTPGADIGNVNGAGCAYIVESCKTINSVTAIACDSYASPSGKYLWTNSGTHYDTINNVFGCDSIIIVNLTINNSTEDTITLSACNNYTSPSGNYTWINNGIYIDTISTVHGCDSIIIINLTIDTVDISVTQSGLNLIANETGASYQWIDCISGNAIAGAIYQLFIPTSNGIYSVEITKNSCKDTSACYIITGHGVIKNDFGPLFNFYPNPSTGKVTIDLGESFKEIDLEARNHLGQIILNKKFKSSNHLSFEIKGSTGIYYIMLSTTEGKSAKFKVMIE